MRSFRFIPALVAAMSAFAASAFAAPAASVSFAAAGKSVAVDYDRSGSADFFDVAWFFSRASVGSQLADVDGDGRVTRRDLAKVISSFTAISLHDVSDAEYLEEVPDVPTRYIAFMRGHAASKTGSDTRTSSGTAEQSPICPRSGISSIDHVSAYELLVSSRLTSTEPARGPPAHQ